MYSHKTQGHIAIEAFNSLTENELNKHTPNQAVNEIIKNLHELKRIVDEMKKED
ncbi:MAG: hypothetical protein HFE49_04835 [Clostridia bacterium]|nr:hypothetical protein [Clostridia bacterium]